MTTTDTPSIATQVKDLVTDSRSAVPVDEDTSSWLLSRLPGKSLDAIPLGTASPRRDTEPVPGSGWVRLAPRSAVERFIPHGQWEGSVLEIFDSYFSAQVLDLHCGEEAYVEFDLREVTPGDRDLMEIGALFYWALGYSISPAGTHSRSSRLHFRRVGPADR